MEPTADSVMRALQLRQKLQEWVFCFCYYPESWWKLGNESVTSGPSRLKQVGKSVELWVTWGLWAVGEEERGWWDPGLRWSWRDDLEFSEKSTTQVVRHGHCYIRQRQKTSLAKPFFFYWNSCPLTSPLNFISSHLEISPLHVSGKTRTLRCQERQEAQDAERQKLSEKIRALERGETVPSSRFGYTTESTGTTSSGAGAALKTATSALKGGIGRLRDGLKIWPEDHVFFLERKGVGFWRAWTIEVFLMPCRCHTRCLFRSEMTRLPCSSWNGTFQGGRLCN